MISESAKLEENGRSDARHIVQQFPNGSRQHDEDNITHPRGITGTSVVVHRSRLDSLLIVLSRPPKSAAGRVASARSRFAKLRQSAIDKFGV